VAEPKEPEPKHLILGDSLTKGLNQVPGSVYISKGGIHPNEVLQLLPTCTDILDVSQYGEIRTVTLIVGTNALDVKSPGKGIPLLDVIFSYEKLVLDLTKLFPNARIGLFNVIPRAYKCHETFDRISLFNNLFESHFTNITPNVSWLRLYWEFVDYRGFLRPDLYGRDGVHLNYKGKMMFSMVIKNFQSSYN
jgi:hypothetical protein